jgi:hypothetical protein
MWKLYDYVNNRRVNEIAEWTRRKLQKTQRLKLRSKLDMLAQAGPDLPPGLLLKTEVEYIFKLKVQGNPKLRPMLCRGPLKVEDKETGAQKDEQGFTLLIGAKEISWEFDPRGADIEAGNRRLEVIRNPIERRCDHERID